MKVTFEASNTQSLVLQLQEFIESFEMGSLVTNFGEQKPGSSIITPKKSPGRPKSNASVKPKIMDIPIPPPTPGPPIEKAPVLDVEQEPIVVSGAAHAVTVEELVNLMQSILAKAGQEQSSKDSALLTIRNILSHFGVKRISELDEKRYHELKHKFEEELSKG